MMASLFTDSLADLFANGMADDGIVDPLDSLDDETRHAVTSLSPRKERNWRQTARDSQIPPDGQWDYWILMAGRGFGKRLRVDCLVPVYDGTMLLDGSYVVGGGWKLMGDLAVGDRVLDESGRPCRVTAVNPAQTPARAYRLTFSDGATIDACDEHQWVTWTHADRKAYLRSEHEPDRRRFPADWPAWRPLRLPTRYLDRGPVEKVLALIAGGWSARRACAAEGLSRNAMRPHLDAGCYVEPTPARSQSPNAPGPRTRTTQDIVDTLTYGKRGDLNHSIPTCDPLDLPSRDDLSVDPWILGYWLGNGTVDRCEMTCNIVDTDDVVARATEAKYDVKVRAIPDRGQSHLVLRDPGLTSRINSSLRRNLAREGVIDNKHVPQRYLWASIEQREALLRGLMDSDGHCTPGGHVEFCSTTRELANAVVQLARSLGQKPVCSEGRAMLDGVDHGPKWRVTWTPTRNPFSVTRKASRVRGERAQELRNHHRMIVAAEEIEPVPMRCITVDSPHSMYLAGEAMIPTHNTFTGANTLAEWACARRADYAVIAPTFGDARKICVESDSGLLTALGDDLDNYNKSDFILYLKNGSRIILASADAPDRVRGYNLAGAWLDEVGSFKDTTVWYEGLAFATRIGDPRYVITTTPRRGNIILTDLIKQFKRGGGDDAIGGRGGPIYLTRGSTFENRANLADSFLKRMERDYAGTTLGAQELEGELLSDVPGALLTSALLMATRVKGIEVPELRRISIGVDPATSTRKGTDSTGIIAAGVGAAPDGWIPPNGLALADAPHIYFLADTTTRERATSEQWARASLIAADKWDADAIAVETNQGGDMVRTVIQQVAVAEGRWCPPVHENVATKGKAVRAEPLQAMWEQHRVHIVGRLAMLEDNLTTWIPGEDEHSPDRLDAGVWAAVDLVPTLATKAATPIAVIAG